MLSILSGFVSVISSSGFFSLNIVSILSFFFSISSSEYFFPVNTGVSFSNLKLSMSSFASSNVKEDSPFNGFSSFISFYTYYLFLIGNKPIYSQCSVDIRCFLFLYLILLPSINLLYFLIYYSFRLILHKSLFLCGFILDVKPSS